MRFCTALLSLASLLNSLPAMAEPILPARIAKAIQERIDANTYPTLVIAYVDGDKSEVLGFGKLADGKKPDGATVYEIGSITKTFTATLLAEAVQSGQVKLDDPIAKLLPDFKIPSRDDSPVDKLVPNFKVPPRNDKQITLLDIATQHSGLPRMPTNFAPVDPADPYADYDAAKLKAFLAYYSLERDPGESYEYSNLAFGLLGFALAQQAHMSYGALLKEKILQPLGMQSSDVTFDANMRAHLAPGHDESGKDTKNWDFDAVSGAGAIRSTGDDMLRYLKANMGLSQTALLPAMKSAQQPRRDVRKDLRIGLAWMTRSAKPSDIVWHNGGTGGYRSFLGFTADGKRGVVVLTNIATEVDALGFAALLDDAALAPVQKAVAMDAAPLDEYVGTYKLAENFLLTISRKDDQLWAQATGQEAIPIFPTARNEFFAKVAGIRISFNRDAADKVSGLVLHQNGDHPAPKLSTAEAPVVPKSVKLDTTTLQGYVGKYRLVGDAVFDVALKDDQLYVQLTGQAAFPIYASAKDKFFYTVVNAQIEFERDASGQVVDLVLHQNGHNGQAARIKP